MRKLLDELNLPMTTDEFLTKSNELYLAAFPSSELLSGAERLIRHLVEHKIPIGKFKRIVLFSFDFLFSRNCNWFTISFISTQN